MANALRTTYKLNQTVFRSAFSRTEERIQMPNHVSWIPALFWLWRCVFTSMSSIYVIAVLPLQHYPGCCQVVIDTLIRLPSAWLLFQSMFGEDLANLNLMRYGCFKFFWSTLKKLNARWKLWILSSYLILFSISWIIVFLAIVSNKKAGWERCSEL